MAKGSRHKKKGRQRLVKLTNDQVAEFLRTVRDDLEFLRSLDYRSPSRTEVRIASSILRRLLYDGMYKSAWAMAGFDGDPTISAVDLQAVVADVDPRFIEYAYAGGAKTDGAHHKGYALLKVPKADREAEGDDVLIERLRRCVRPGETREFSLQEFIASPAVISGDAAMSRLGVVRYVANKLGGVHWDSKREAWSHPIGSRQRLLDEEHIFVGRLPAALYEVVSIADAVSSCNDTARMIARVEEVAPEEERGTEILSFREGRIGKYADLTFGPKNAD